MLVPVKGGIENLQKRNRQIFLQQAGLATLEIPKVYIFNVGPREWRGVGGGKQYTIPACPPGERYSEPVGIPMLTLSEFDMADGGNNMGVLQNAGISAVLKVGEEEQIVPGVADDVIGINSTVRNLELNTTNGEWFGIFYSRFEEPTEEQLEAANEKLREMMQLIYAEGSEKVQAGEKVLPLDRRRYNEAAELLRVAPLWGNLDHQMDACPECGEDIRKGAKVCKHCHLAIDPASIEARRINRERENDALLADDEGEEDESGMQDPPNPTEPERTRKKKRTN
jgi:hypothetical protein